jgi:hypothetical protein
MAARKDGLPKARRKDWESVEEKIERLSLPIPECGCFAWLGKHNPRKGYAQIDYREGGRRHHRNASTVVYEVVKGRVPIWQEVSHLCLQEWCVNPDHLIAETHKGNLDRRRPFDHRTWGGLCKRGHVLPPAEMRNKNLSCPICYKEYQAEYRRRGKERRAQYRATLKERRGSDGSEP